MYFLSSLAADLTSIEVLVFLREAETFIGIVNPRIVKERLAQCYPIIKRYEEALDRSGPPRADLRPSPSLRPAEGRRCCTEGRRCFAEGRRCLNHRLAWPVYSGEEGDMTAHRFLRTASAVP